MKKTLTVTYQDSDNYGSVLQAYALQKVIEDMGFENEIIDYRKPEVAEVYKIIKHIHNKHDFLSNIYNALNIKLLRLRKDRFESFRENNLKLTKRKYSTFNQLNENPPLADCYVCGSDQVWNVGIVDFDETYLLQFVKEGRKLSYAASGIKEYTTTEQLLTIANQAKTFDAVSVRENIAKKRLKSITGIVVERVLDPVLLLNKDEWGKLTYDYSDRAPYMMCYFVGGVSKDFEKYTNNIAKKLGLKRILIMSDWKNIFRSGEKRYDCGPIEFLSLIKYADLVCTNSFHGTALSIIFNKAFQVGMHVPFKEDRITTLLKLCELTEREIDPKNIKADESCLDINYDKANQKLEIEKKRCLDWLNQAIEGENT